MYRHTKLRTGMGYRIEDVERLIFFASVAMSDSDGNLQAAMFADCMLAYERNIGEFHVLDFKNKQTAFCFVLDKYESEKGARHLHLVSVVKSERGKGVGRMLIDHVMNDIGTDPVTLESQPASHRFFEKMGFSTLPGELEHGLLAMFANGDGSCDSFKKPIYHRGLGKVYEKRFDDIARSMGF